jgi:hypothetical protein
VREVRPERDGRSVVEASRMRWQQYPCAAAATTCDGGEKLMAGTVGGGVEERARGAALSRRPRLFGGKQELFSAATIPCAHES